MKTMTQGGYIVGFDGKGHRITKDGVVVYEDDQTIHVGKSHEGHLAPIGFELISVRIENTPDRGFKIKTAHTGAAL